MDITFEPLSMDKKEIQDGTKQLVVNISTFFFFFFLPNGMVRIWQNKTNNVK